MNKLDLALNNIFIASKVPSKKLMIILHGRGDSSEGFKFLPLYFNMPEMNYLLLDAPFEYFGGCSWYDLPPNQKEGIDYSSAVLTKIFDEVFSKNFDIKQSILFGFSQGSLLTFEFGTRYHQSFAGYISISGYIYDEKKLLEDMNKDVLKSHWLCTHGTLDEVVPYEASQKQIEYLQENGFGVEFKTYEKEHTIDQDEIHKIKDWIINRII